MFNFPTTTTGVLAALVGAGAYHVPPPAAAAAAAQILPDRAFAEIRQAQVDLYCDHTAQAVAGIRALRERLQWPHEPLHAKAVAHLDRAAWSARQGRVSEAEQALQDALTSLQADAQGRAG